MENQPVKITIEDGVELMLVPVYQETGYQQVCQLSKNLDKATGAIRTFSQKIKEAIQEASPDEASIEFSIGFGLETSDIVAILVKSNIDANVKVTLTWKRQSPDGK